MNPFTNPSMHIANNCYVNTVYQALHSGLEVQRVKRQRTCLHIAHSVQQRGRPVKSATVRFHNEVSATGEVCQVQWVKCRKSRDWETF